MKKTLQERNINTLFFDLDNTLLPSEKIYESILQQLGFSQKSAPYANARKQVKLLLSENHVSARNRLLYFKTILEEQKIFSAQALLKLMQEYEFLLQKEFSFHWMHLKREKLLKKLSDKYKLCLVTNENLRTQSIKLNAMDPEGKIFSALVTSEELGVEKPHKKIFEHALQKMDTTPANSLFIGDSINDDILPAVELDLHAIHTSEFLPSETPIPATALSIQNLQQLEELLL